MNSACKQDLFISSPTSTVFSLAWLQPLLHICRKKKHTAVGEPRVAKVPRKKNAAKNQQVTAVQQCSLLAPHSNFSFTSTMAYSARHCYSGQRQQQRHSHSVFPFCQKHNFNVCVIARTEGLFKFAIYWKCCRKVSSPCSRAVEEYSALCSPSAGILQTSLCHSQFLMCSI